jgi:hypothetical protein
MHNSMMITVSVFSFAGREHLYQRLTGTESRGDQTHQIPVPPLISPNNLFNREAQS